MFYSLEKTNDWSHYHTDNTISNSNMKNTRHLYQLPIIQDTVNKNFQKKFFKWLNKKILTERNLCVLTMMVNKSTTCNMKKMNIYIELSPQRTGHCWTQQWPWRLKSRSWLMGQAQKCGRVKGFVGTVNYLHFSY